MMNKAFLLIRDSIPKTARLIFSYQQNAYMPYGYDALFYYLNDRGNRTAITYDQPIEVDTFREIGFGTKRSSGGFFPDPLNGNFYISPEESQGIIIRTEVPELSAATHVDYFQAVAATAKVVFSFS